MTLIENLEKRLEDIPRPTQPIVPTKPIDISTSIVSFKENVVKYANEALEDTLDIKEVKDLTSIITMIENSLSDKTDANPTINILVQNILDKQKDDC